MLTSEKEVLAKHLTPRRSTASIKSKEETQAWTTSWCDFAKNLETRNVCSQCSELLLKGERLAIRAQTEIADVLRVVTTTNEQEL
jgi:hypothetical protein